MRTFLRTTLLLPFCILLVGTAFGQTPTTTIQNGNADTRLELNYDGGFYIPGTFDPAAPADSIPATGAGTRLMWYPAKAAFRAGRVFDNTAFGTGVDGRTFWNPANVGNYSVAFGNNTTASGDMSFAAGINTAASEKGAAAIGLGTEASGEAAIATGKNTSAFQENATAMGEGTTASGRNATAMGDVTLASGFAATAMGSDTKAIDFLATAMGNKTIARGDNSTAMGLSTEASGNEATAMGDNTTASGEISTATGRITTASGDHSMAMGFETEASGLNATAIGELTTASGRSATAMGISTIAASENSLSIGELNSANTSADGTLLVVGNGSSGAGGRSDALALDSNGNLEISGALAESSDRRLKTSIRPLKGETMAKLLRLRPIRYQFKNQETHPAGEQIGLVAQDVRTEFPALVSGENGDALSLSYSKFTAVLLKGLQEQQAELEAKEDDIATLKAENEEFEERLAALERQNASAMPAGLTGPWALTLLLGLGLLGAGLFWRRRASNAD